MSPRHILKRVGESLASYSERCDQERAITDDDIQDGATWLATHSEPTEQEKAEEEQRAIGAKRPLGSEALKATTDRHNLWERAE